MHALRIGIQGIELLQTGRISLPVPEPDRARLREVRAGTPTLGEIVDELDDVTARLEALVAASDLPERADHARVDAFLVSTYERAWSSLR